MAHAFQNYAKLGHFKPWPNGVASRRKLKTWVYLRLRLDTLKFLLQSDELLVSEMPKKLGVVDFVSEIKRGENYPDFEKLAHVIRVSMV